MKRTLSLVLVLAMVFTAMLGIIPAAEAEAEKSGMLVVSKAQLVFADNVYLNIAVDYTGVCDDEETAKSSIYIKVTNKAGEVTKLDVDPSIEAPAGCVAFQYTDITAKEMGDYIKIQAYYDGVASGVAVKDYSIYECALKSKEANADNADLVDVIDKMIKFGAAAQKAFAYVGDVNLNSKFLFVTLKGGATFTDGSTSKKIEKYSEEEFSVIHPVYGDKVVWFNGSGEMVGKGLSYSVDTYFKGDSASLTVFALPVAAANCLDSYTLMNSTEKSVTNGISEAVAKLVEDYANGVEGAKDKFTLSLTIAADTTLGGYIHFRNTSFKSGSGVLTAGTAGSRLNLWRFYSGNVGTRYNAKGSATTMVAFDAIPVSDTAGTPGEFIQLDIVFDFTERTMKYYLGGNLEHTATMPAALTTDYFTAKNDDGNYGLIIEPQSLTDSYVKNIFVYGGIFEDYAQ